MKDRVFSAEVNDKFTFLGLLGLFFSLSKELLHFYFLNEIANIRRITSAVRLIVLLNV